MDIARPSNARAKLIRRIILGGVAVLFIGGVSFGLTRLRPAAPSVDRATIWTDEVKRGPMLRDVRGLGTLVPETTWTVPAASDGRVSKRNLLPGTSVKADTVILVLTNPQLQQEALDAQFQLKGAQAGYEQTKAQLQNQLMDKRTSAAQISAQYRSAEMEKETKDQLLQNGLAPALDVK